MEPLPPCKACQEIFEGKSCAHEGSPCPTADGKPDGFPTCSCFHCRPREEAVRTWTTIVDASRWVMIQDRDGAS